jgi:hypothetical protein
MSSWILPVLDRSRLPSGTMRIVKPLDMRGSGAVPAPATPRSFLPPQPNAAAQRAPDRAPEPETKPSPARPAAEQEEVMKGKKVAERVLDALRTHGACTIVQLAEHADTTAGTLGTIMGTLVKEHGLVKHQPDRSKAALYSLGKGKPAPVEKPKRVNGEAPAPTPPKPKPNGHAAFAINEAGQLGIEKEGLKLSLDGQEFERLRSFIERTEPVWKGA